LLTIAGGCLVLGLVLVLAGDYVLLDTKMPVDQALVPGGSASFAGAAIGFDNKTVNQDGCWQAVVHLLYTAMPE
jgi:hypothetical protein